MCDSGYVRCDGCKCVMPTIVESACLIPVTFLCNQSTPSTLLSTKAANGSKSFIGFKTTSSIAQTELIDKSTILSVNVELMTDGTLGPQDQYLNSSESQMWDQSTVPLETTTIDESTISPETTSELPIDSTMLPTTSMQDPIALTLNAEILSDVSQSFQETTATNSSEAPIYDDYASGSPNPDFVDSSSIENSVFPTTGLSYSDLLTLFTNEAAISSVSDSSTITYIINLLASLSDQSTVISSKPSYSDVCSTPTINLTRQVLDAGCPSGYCFKCDSGEIFDFLAVWMNCRLDCADGSDEQCYPGHIKCDGLNGCLCIPIDKITASNCPIYPQCLNSTSSTVATPSNLITTDTTVSKGVIAWNNDSCNPPNVLDRITGNCGNATGELYIHCGDGSCFPLKSVYMNCIYDCPDMVDEICMPGLVKCDGCKCVPEENATLLCNNYSPANNYSSLCSSNLSSTSHLSTTESVTSEWALNVSSFQNDDNATTANDTSTTMLQNSSDTANPIIVPLPTNENSSAESTLVPNSDLNNTTFLSFSTLPDLSTELYSTTANDTSTRTLQNSSDTANPIIVPLPPNENSSASTLASNSDLSNTTVISFSTLPDLSTELYSTSLSSNETSIQTEYSNITFVPCPICSSYAECNESSICACNPGYIGDGLTCAIDECFQKIKHCASNAHCTSNYAMNEFDTLITSFNCICDAGFSGDGIIACFEANSSLSNISTVLMTSPQSSSSITSSFEEIINASSSTEIALSSTESIITNMSTTAAFHLTNTTNAQSSTSSSENITSHLLLKNVSETVSLLTRSSEKFTSEHSTESMGASETASTSTFSVASTSTAELSESSQIFTNSQSSYPQSSFTASDNLNFSTTELYEESSVAASDFLSSTEADTGSYSSTGFTSTQVTSNESTTLYSLNATDFRTTRAEALVVTSTSISSVSLSASKASNATVSLGISPGASFNISSSTEYMASTVASVLIVEQKSTESSSSQTIFQSTPSHEILVPPPRPQLPATKAAMTTQSTASTLPQTIVINIKTAKLPTSGIASSTTTTYPMTEAAVHKTTTVSFCTACSQYATCLASGANLNCTCSAGFIGDGLNCAVDECHQGIKQCAQNAVCNSKYVITELGSLVTSFNCICNDGYYGDGVHNCSQGPCETKRHNCSSDAICIPDQKVWFKYSCACKTNFVGDGYACFAADGCKTQKVSCRNDTEICIPTGKSTYRCDCKPNLFKVKGKCVSDLCGTFAVTCPTNSVCKTLNDSYSCSCVENYFLSGTKCILHPCASGNHNCSFYASCLPSKKGPSYDCACMDNYYGNGYSCIPDPCLFDLANCGADSQCISTNNGSYFCRCNPNYYVQDGHCVLNPCFNVNSPPCSSQAKCLPNYPWPDMTKDYTCSCLSPYVGDGKTCKLPTVTNAPKACNEKNSWHCPITGTCISPNWVMDGVKDCPNGEDENPTLVNECTTGKAGCHKDAVCHNIPNGKYACTCKSGFFGDGFTCYSPSTVTSTTKGHKTFACKGIGSEWQCPISKLCIPKEWLNDGIKDCPDGEDESTKLTTKIVKPVLSVTKPQAPCEFNCTSETRCIPSNWILDHIKDCKGGEDEDPVKVDECKFKKHKCHPNAKCDKIVGGTYKCTCNAGFTGDGLTCVGLGVLQVDRVIRRSSVCYFPLDESQNCSLGYGRPITKWFFDTKDKTCKGFKYTGCGGNANNFATKTDCVASCLVSGKCNPGYFECPLDLDCIPYEHILDGIIDCRTGAQDENPAHHDECVLRRHKCDRNATCQNLHGGTYKCTCKSGFAGDGLRCTPCTASTCQKPKILTFDLQGELKPVTKTDAVVNRVSLKSSSKWDLRSYECNVSSICVPESKIMDGISDCEDQSDENRYNFNICQLQSTLTKCDLNALCVPTSSGRYYCKCKLGFYGSGTRGTCSRDHKYKH